MRKTSREDVKCRHETFQETGCSKKQDRLKPTSLNVTQAAIHKGEMERKIKKKRKKKECFQQLPTNLTLSKQMNEIGKNSLVHEFNAEYSGDLNKEQARYSNSGNQFVSWMVPNCLVY